MCLTSRVELLIGSLNTRVICAVSRLKSKLRIMGEVWSRITSAACSGIVADMPTASLPAMSSTTLAGKDMKVLVLSFPRRALFLMKLLSSAESSTTATSDISGMTVLVLRE